MIIDPPHEQLIASYVVSALAMPAISEMKSNNGISFIRTSFGMIDLVNLLQKTVPLSHNPNSPDTTELPNYRDVYDRAPGFF